MTAIEYRQNINALLEQTGMEVLELLKDADLATLEELIDQVPDFIASMVQYHIENKK